MKRSSALGTLVLAGALTLPWLGNTAVFASSKGLTLVDTKSPGWGQPLLDKIKTLSDKPITTVITHTHYSHVSGNVALPATVEIIAHENTAKMMPNNETVFKANPGKGLPKRTFKDKLTIGSGVEPACGAGRLMGFQHGR